MSTSALSAGIPYHLASDPLAREGIKPELAPGEELLWAGRANPAASAIFTSGITLLMAVLLVSRGGTQNLFAEWWSRSQFSYLFHAIVSIISFYLFMDRRTFYGVTNRRFVHIGGTGGCFSVAFDALKLLPFGIIGFSGEGIQFDQFDGLTRSRRYYLMFIGRDAAAVYQLAMSARGRLLDDSENATIAAFSANGPSTTRP
jgi:hypothetical protein